MAKKRTNNDSVDQLIGGIVVILAVLIYYKQYDLLKAYAPIIFVLFTIFIIYIFVLIRRKKRLRSSGIQDIDQMTGKQFEEYLSELFSMMGYSSRVTQQAGDYGADIVLTKDNRRIVVQAKRYKKNVGIKAVQEIYGAINHYKAHEGWVVTNSRYTKAAESLAKSNSVKLYGREQLIELILKANATK